MSQDEYFSDAMNEIIRSYEEIRQSYEEIRQMNAETIRVSEETIRICAEMHRLFNEVNQGSNPLSGEVLSQPDVEETSSSTKPWLMICN